MARATATVLFTDLVGSTEQAVTYGERFEEARRAHDALLRNTVDANHGSVVKGTGDGVMATFDVVADGIAAARAVQQGIHRHNRRHPEPALSIRVGLSVGDVSFEDGDYYGESVIQAARLCQLAAGGQILAAAVVRALAGGSRAAGFVDVGALPLKGLPDPLDVVEIQWERPGVTAIALPPRLAASAPTFVGRSAELEQLHHAFRDVEAGGRRRVLLLGGEPGVGKTTLVSHASRIWYDGGATVAMGRCEEDVRASYRPFADALAPLVAAAPIELLAAHVARHGAALLSLAPGLAGRIADLPESRPADPESERYLLFAAVEDLLVAFSEQAPLVLFLDDLHWADAGTASLLRSLATAPDPARLLVIGTFRSDELPVEEPIGQAFAAFRRVPAVSRLDLGGLVRDDVLELVRHWTGVDASASAERLADDLVAETDGNAFFVTEVIRHLGEIGFLERMPVAIGASLVPDSVRDVLSGRIARLGSVGEEVLAAAAVVGHEFALALVSAVTGVADQKLLDVLDQAAAAALVREVPGSPGRYVFTHALVQHAIVAGLGVTREAALHRRVAEVLEVDHAGVAPVAELAHHWVQATMVSDTRRARDWVEQAGDAALAALAPGDGVAYYRQALLLHDQLRDDDVAARIDLLVKLGTAERQAGDAEHRDTLLKACRLARRLGDGERLAAAALANNSGTFANFQGVDAERVEMLEAAIDSGAGDAGLRGLLHATLANELTYSGDYSRRRALAEDAVREARAHGDPSLLLRVLNLVFFPLWVPETLAERLAITGESLALLGEIDDPLPRFWASKSGYLNCVQAGRTVEGDALLRVAVREAERLAQPALLWRARHTEACRLILRGEPDAAEPFAREALALGERAGEFEAGVYFRTQQMSIDWERGVIAELAARIKGTSPRPPNATASLALVFAEGGREDEAAALLDAAADRHLGDLAHDPTLVTCLGYYAEAAIRLRHAAAADVLYERMLPFADQIGFDGVATVGGLEHHLGGLAGVLGRADEAEARLRRSAAFHEGIEARFFEARSRVELARVLAPHDAAGAREEAQRALALAEEHGYAAGARDAAAATTS